MTLDQIQNEVNEIKMRLVQIPKEQRNHPLSFEFGVQMIEYIDVILRELVAVKRNNKLVADIQLQSVNGESIDSLLEDISDYANESSLGDSTKDRNNSL